MAELDPHVRPVPFARLESIDRSGTAELADLEALRSAGLPVAPLVVVPAAAEERFYRLNNLPRRLLVIFGAVDPADPDEDDVEEAVPAARALLTESYLLDEFIDAFYDAMASLEPRLRVRRPDADGEVALRGRPALLAFKHVLRDDWSFDAVWQRLEGSGGIGLEARPVLLHGAEERDADAELEGRAAAILGRAVRLQVGADGGVTRVGGLA